VTGAKDVSIHLYLDSADLSALRPYLALPMVYGVTTNPTLQREAGLRESELEEFVNNALDLGAQAVQVQVKHPDAAGMIADAKQFVSWAEPGRVIPKIPVTSEGLKAAAHMKAEGASCTMTAVYQPEQVIWALLAGAHYAAPYLGRLNDAGRDGLAVIAEMQGLLRRYQDEQRYFRLLVASVRTRQDFQELLALGVGAITVRPSLFAELLDDAGTLRAEQAFLSDADQVR
jgi:transaldolase